MGDPSRVEQGIILRGERCTVVAERRKGTWEATGTFGGTVLTVRRSGTAAQAFEWWKNKAGMQHRG